MAEMAGSPRTMLFVMDPVEAMDISADTTFVLMLEAQGRGHEVLYADPSWLSVAETGPRARCRPVTLRRELGNHADLGPERIVDLDAEVDVAFQRKDPPVDVDFVSATQILGLCTRTVVLNRPAGILAANEKLYAMHFPELMAETLVTRRIAELRDFMEKLGGEMVVKPLDGKGGEGIFHVHSEDRNLGSILEQSTRFETRWIMAQRYLPQVRQGDKRILLVDGEPIGAVLRVPSEKEVRSNLHVGGRPARATLDADDRRIVDTLAPALRRDGLFFVGIDVIGGHLTEVNVTSPTGIQEINTLDDTCLEARVLDGVETLLRGR
jgi:glutathione synthase